MHEVDDFRAQQQQHKSIGQKKGPLGVEWDWVQLHLNYCSQVAVLNFVITDSPCTPSQFLQEGTGVAFDHDRRVALVAVLGEKWLYWQNVPQERSKRYPKV